LFTARDN